MRQLAIRVLGIVLVVNLNLACGSGTPTHRIPSTPGIEEDDPYACCDPDQIPCRCQGVWHCTESSEGKSCSQQNPELPDDGGQGAWDCGYDETDLVCRGEASQHPDAGGDGGWTCTPIDGDLECRRASGDQDYPEDPSAGWDCEFGEGGDSRACRTIGPQGGGQDHDPDGTEPEEPGTCATRETCGNGDDDDCNGLADCADPACACGTGEEQCDGSDNDQDGRIDEGRVCGDATDGDGPCPPGAYRICDAYCGVHQLCGADGTWGACREDDDCSSVSECSEHSDCARGDYCDFGSCTPGSFGLGPCVSDDDCNGFDGGFGDDDGDDDDDGDFGGGVGAFRCEQSQGVCVLDCFHHADCAVGLVCDMGECVTDPYVPGDC